MKSSLSAGLFHDRQLNFLLAVNVLVVLLATWISHGQFVSIDNLQSMGGQLPELGLLALGIMLSMVSGNGGIDLSGVGLANLSGMVAALIVPKFISGDDSPMLYTSVFCVIVVCMGAIGGFINGVVIARLRLTPILCTLGTQLLFTGCAVVLSNGASVHVDYVEPLSDIGNGTWFQVPVAFVIFIAAVVVLGWLLRRSPFGLRLYLMGTNPKAAFYTGIPRARMLILTYTMCGILASLAGLISVAHTSSAKWDYGNSYLLIAILIAVMGGVNPAGGYGRIVCVFFAATVLQFLSSFFNLLGVSQFFGDCAWGFLLLASLAFAGGERVRAIFGFAQPNQRR
ncbi:ABC transporter permease [Paraburkholderia sabiae]|uniref:ABC transporter permease n=1 Tax=Paraburkholderia sabiae TaxID=273251 RepID=A0ABU9QAQ7_9BURK|nr:ABC transporter permease [Paraburkholderia sabiae]WJZ72479.1 ABC transporter permease [Paraburkholderia sabiae]CAD6536422.1 Ribose import permease protein RbsC [Paraburkholderia sabiae]CAG9228452.1 Monosaccharide-transporting ATPase [Paraburkholderia sabiae]